MKQPYTIRIKEDRERKIEESYTKVCGGKRGTQAE
jgi:hypothetical protein